MNRKETVLPGGIRASVVYRLDDSREEVLENTATTSQDDMLLAVGGIPFRLIGRFPNRKTAMLTGPGTEKAGF